VGGDAGAAELRREVAALQAIGVNTHLVSPSDLRDLQPGANVDDVSLAAFEPESGYADPVAATQSLADRARALGAVFKTGTFLRSIRVNNGRVSGVDTTVGPIETLNVVLTAGPWTDAFLKPLGLEIGIQSVRAQVAFYDRPLELKTGHAAFVDRLTGAHFRPHTFGLTMVGYNDPPAQVLSNPDRLDETVSQDTVADLRQRIAVRLPAMSSARFTRGHAGIYDQSPDGRPILGRVPGIHGLYVGAGLSGNGFAFAPAAGAAIAELVADGEATVADLTPFSIDRFRME
jgi:glycine/D-amino acid oxidase-like deaminating enzyme